MRREQEMSIRKFVAECQIPDTNLQLSVWSDDEFAYSVVNLVRKVAYLKSEGRLTLPLSWWQHFKMQYWRWFPKWFRIRWPIQYKEYQAEAWFPDVELPRDRMYERVLYHWNKED